MLPRRGRGLVTHVAVVGLVASSLALVPATAVTADEYKYCEYGNYTPRNRLVSAEQVATVTHLSTFTANPNYSKTVTRTVNLRTVIRGSVRLEGEVSASLGNKIISKGEARLSMALAAAGSRTKATDTTVTETVKNTSKQNATIVMFRGNTKGYGRWKRSTCQQVSGSVGDVDWIYGRWSSFATMHDGYVQCGAGTENINSLAKKAYRIGCG